MGRQKGKQQRTKGNVAPSSSARSADLLSKDREHLGTTLFQSLSTGGLGNVPELDGLDSITNSEFRMTLKKLYKRDVTTKLKALGEFSDLCESSSVDDVVTTLPYWPRIYNRLFEDGDRRVREGAQKALHSLVKSVGKNLAPHLKNFMGYWFVSQVDPYAPSAFVAEAALGAAFRGEKKLEAFIFCREEILKVINLYLFRTSLKYTEEKKDEENNANRIIACCLEAFAMYVKTVAKCKPQADEIESILNRTQFWKFQKHKYPPLRGGFYSVLEALAIVLPEILEKHLSDACKATFHRLDESHISICKPLYGAVVALTSTYDSWYEFVDINKGVLPSLCNTLKNGCYGIASIVLPSLLPLLSKFPPTCGLLHAYNKIYEGMHECLQHDQILSSKRNLKLAVTTFVELLQLLVSQIYTNKDVENTTDIVQFVVQKNLIYILKLSFEGKENKLSTSGLYKLIARVVHSWTTKKQSIADDDLYKILCSSLWHSITAVTHSHVSQNKSDDCANTVTKILKFFHEVLCSQTFVEHQNSTADGPKQTVKFAEDETVLKSGATDVGNDEFKNSNEFLDIQKNVNLILCETIYCHPFVQSLQMLTVYRDVLRDFANKELFEMIVEKQFPLSEESECSARDPLFYFNEVLMKDIMSTAKTHENISSEVIHCILADILFYCLIHCKNMEKMPDSLKELCLAGFGEPKFSICLHFFLRLTSPEAPASFVIWMKKDLNNKESLAWSFMATLLDNLMPHMCTHQNATMQIESASSNDGWRLLTNLFTSSHNSKGEEDMFICGQQAFEDVMNSLNTQLKTLKAECSCLECYNTSLVNTAKFLTSCIPRQFDFAFMSDVNSNTWLTMASSLLQTYCMLTDDKSQTLTMFSTCLEHICHKLPSEKISASQLSEFIRNEMVWLKDNFMLNSHILPNLERVKNAVEAVLSTLQLSGHNHLVFILIECFLPCRAEWEEIRTFKTEEWCDNKSATLERLPYLTQDEETEKSKSVETKEGQQYVSVVDAYYEMCQHIVSLLQQESCTSDKILVFCEEYVISSVFTNKDINPSLLDTLDEDFCKKFSQDMLDKSLHIGGIWTYCIQNLRSLITDEICKDVIDSLIKCLDQGLQVSNSLIETALVMSRIHPSSEVRNIPEKILANLSSKQPDEISANEIALFSMGVQILTQSVHDISSDLMSYVDLVLIWRTAKESLFLFDMDLSSVQYELMLLNTSVACLFDLAVKTLCTQLTEVQWDFICCLLVSWLEGVAVTVEKCGTMKPMTLLILCGAAKLADRINKFMASPAATDDPTVPNNLTSEWSEFFSVSVHSSLMRIFVNACSCEKLKIPHYILGNICRSLLHVSENDLMSTLSHLKPKLSANSRLSNEIQTLLNHICPLLFPQKVSNADNCFIQMTAYNLLCRLIPQIKVTEGNSCAPIAIRNIIEKSSTLIRNLFIAIKSDSPKSSKPQDSEGSDQEDEDSDEEVDQEELDISSRPDIVEYATPLLAYLLSWKLLIKLTKHLPSEHRSSYVDALMTAPNLHISDDLLPKLFKIMPGKSGLFKADPKSFYEAELEKEDIEHIACSVYKEYLMEMPAASRMWFNDLSKVARSRVDKFTSTFVSPVLIEQELRAIQATKREQAMEGMEIIARPSAREVYASYKINEVDMEITVCLSANHPLGPISVNTEKRAGVVMGQWRYWILQITTFLQYQNGGIIDGLLLWKDKVDKRFEGLEECMICFSLVHGSNQSLPKLKCKTCKKKFHAVCLYKWFDTSNNSTCPLCRSPMIFR